MPIPTASPNLFPSRTPDTTFQRGAINNNSQAYTDSQVSVVTSSLAALNFTGFKAWTSGADAATYTITGGMFQIDRAGIGYIKGVEVTWVAAQQTGVLTSFATHWIMINSSGVLTSTSSVTGSTFTDNIILYEVHYDGTNYCVVKENHSYDFPTKVSSYLHANLNTVIRGTGAIIAPVATGDGSSSTHREVKVTGADTMDDHGLSTTIPDSAGAGVTINTMYLNASSKYVRYSQSTELPMYYNASGTPTILNAVNEVFCAYPIYVSKDDIETSTPVYFSIMDSNAEDNLNAVIDNINSGSYQYASGELKSLELCQLGFIIMEYSAAGGRIAHTIVAKNTFKQELIDGMPAAHLPIDAFSGLSKITVGATEPTSPRIGDVWIEVTL